MAAANPDRPLLETFAQKFDYLCSTVFPRSLGRPYTNKEIAEAITALGFDVTDEYLRLLRKGKRDNPGFELVAAIAKSFRVPVTYFVNGQITEEARDVLDLAREVLDADYLRIAELCRGLSEASITAIDVVIRQFRRLEGLDDDEGSGA